MDKTTSQTISWGCSEIAALKTLENYQKERMYWSSHLIQLHEYSLQPTTGLHYRYILEVLRKEKML